MEDKQLIKSILTVYKNGNSTTEETVDLILKAYSKSNRFNFFNFHTGFCVGTIIMLILKLTNII